MSYRVLTLVLLAAVDCQVAGKLILKPQNTDAKVNHSTYFNCSTDIDSTEIFWFHGAKYVYIGSAILEPYHERFKVDRKVWNGTYIYNLVIHSVQPGDAGEFRCAEDEGFGEKYSVQLVVLDDDPICRSSIELGEVIGQNSCNVKPDEVELECRVRYHGNIPPQMEWKKVGENSSDSLETSIVIFRNHYISTLKLRGDIALNNSSFVCETKRTTQKPNKCISNVIRIAYAVSGNSTANKTMKDEITCNANTSQSCTYKWRWLQDNEFTIESSIAVLKAKKTGWHRCEAECFLRNYNCNLLVMRAFIAGDKESNQTWTILIIAAVVFITLTLVVVGVLIYVCLRRHKTKDSRDVRTLIGLDKFGRDRADLNELLKKPARAIYGLAVLGDELFIARLQWPEIEVYNAVTFLFDRRMKVDGMINTENIASCSVNNCLYSFDWGKEEEHHAILRIDPNNGKLIKTWVINVRGGRLSVASDTNIILNINFEGKLREYTADGELIRIINLDAESTGIFRFWHALKLDSGLFVVCRGGYDDPQTGVYLLKTKANSNLPGRTDEANSNTERTDEVEVVKTFGTATGDPADRLIEPLYLSVDRKGSILVSDKKTVLLSSNLDKPQVIVSEEDGLQRSSWRTCFVETTGQWLVTDYYNVIICRVKKRKVHRELKRLIPREDERSSNL